MARDNYIPTTRHTPMMLDSGGLYDEIETILNGQAIFGDLIEAGGANPWLYAPLTSGLTLTYGTGTFTLTRATVASGKTTDDLVYFETSGNPVYWGDDGVLLQAARTNLCLQSQNLSTTWTNVQSTDTQTVGVAPDGTNTANSINENGANASHYVVQAIALANTTQYTYSVYMKASNRTWAVLQVYGLPGSPTQYFNLSTGNTGTPSGSPDDSGMEDAGNGWWRCWMTFTTGTVTTSNAIIASADGDGGVSYQGITQESILVWQADLEAGAYPTSTTLTTTLAVPRNADVLELDQAPPTNDFYIELDWTPREDTGETERIWTSYLNAINSLTLSYNGTSDLVLFTKLIAGASYTASYPLTITLGTTYKIKGVLDTTDGVQVYVDGDAGTPHANTAAAVVGTTTQIGAVNSLQQTALAVKNLEIHGGYTASIYQGQKDTTATEVSESLATGVTGIHVVSDAGTGVVHVEIDGVEVFTVTDGGTNEAAVSGSTISWYSDNTGTIQLGQGKKGAI